MITLRCLKLSQELGKQELLEEDLNHHSQVEDYLVVAA